MRNTQTLCSLSLSLFSVCVCVCVCVCVVSLLSTKVDYVRLTRFSISSGLISLLGRCVKFMGVAIGTRARTIKPASPGLASRLCAHSEKKCSVTKNKPNFTLNTRRTQMEKKQNKTKNTHTTFGQNLKCKLNNQRNKCAIRITKTNKLTNKKMKRKQSKK